MFKIININELLEMLKNYNHKELHIHHTWKPSHKDYNGSNGLELQEGMKRYHVNTLGWSDIGQHVTLLPDGHFVTGRYFNKTPSSIKGFNAGSFSVEMIGNFDIENNVLDGKQKQSILKLSKYFFDNKKYIRFHNENSGKTCPGTSIDKIEFMKEVENYKDTVKQKHWAQQFYDFLTKEKNITIHEIKFDDKITQGEVITLIARALGYKEDK